jgi:hypothetical protein
MGREFTIGLVGIVEEYCPLAQLVTELPRYVDVGAHPPVVGRVNDM